MVATAIFTALLAGSTIALWRSTEKLAKQAKDQGEDFRASIEVARQSAVAAAKSADIAERALTGVERPMLFMRIKSSNPPMPQPSRFSEQKVFEVIIEFELVNYGRLPAVVHDLIVHSPGVRRKDGQSLIGELAKPGSDATLGIPVVPADQMIIVSPNGGSETLKDRAYYDIEGDKLAEFWGIGKRRAVLIGMARYRDPIGIERELGFTFLYNPFKNEWWPLEDAGYYFDRIVQPDRSDNS